MQVFSHMLYLETENFAKWCKRCIEYRPVYSMTKYNHTHVSVRLF